MRLHREIKILNAVLTGNILEEIFNDGIGFSKKPQKDLRSEKDAYQTQKLRGFVCLASSKRSKISLITEYKYL